MVNESPRKDPRSAASHKETNRRKETEGHAQTQRKGIHDKKKPTSIICLAETMSKQPDTLQLSCLNQTASILKAQWVTFTGLYYHSLIIMYLFM